MRPRLSAEALLLVELFMPVCQAQQQRIKQLEDQLAVNSNNSSTPPSQDQHRSAKKRSLRKASGKKPGGQPGHKGVGPKLTDQPDEIIEYSVNECPDCGGNLAHIEPDGIIRRQVEDLPPIKTFVIEHQLELKTCPCCAVQWQAGGCPVDHEFEYGPRIKALCVYLSAYQFIPAQRTKHMMSALGVDLSTGSLDNFRRRAAKELPPFLKGLRRCILACLAAFFDETSTKVSGVNHWVHVACTELYGLFNLHRKRGREAHQVMDVLPHFTGILHRDDYSPYHVYDQATHSLCNAHLLRDMKYIEERNDQGFWTGPLADLLLKIKAEVEARKQNRLSKKRQREYRRQYDKLIKKGLAANPPAKRKDGQQRGRTAQSKTVNLLWRLRDRADQVLRFMTHTEARFDNNQAERDLRMNKVRQKVSGGFRSLTAGEEFMSIRSLIVTAVKQGADPIEELVHLFTPGDNQHMRLVSTPE